MVRKSLFQMVGFWGFLGVVTAFGVNVTNDIVSDQTWTVAGSPYNICRLNCTVASNVTLTIEPGVRVQFGSRNGETWMSGTEPLRAELFIQGRLNAEGVTFTSYAPSNDPQAGDWARLLFESGSVGRLTNCVVEYGGAGVVTYGQVQVRGTSDVRFDGCEFRHAANKGVHIHGDATGRVDVVDCVFSNLMTGVGTDRDSGIALRVEDSRFVDLSWVGLFLLNAESEIRGCVFTNVAAEDVLLWDSNVNNWWCKDARVVSNRFVGGGKAAFPVAMYGGVNFEASGNETTGYTMTNDGVRVGGWVEKGRSARWGANDMGYIVRDTLTVDGDAGSKGALTIADGSVVSMYPAMALRVWGDLTVEGTAGQGVEFTSASVVAPHGFGILFDQYRGNSELRGCRFQNMWRGVYMATIQTNAARVRLAGCTFSNLLQDAIQVQGATGVDVLVVSNSLVTGCGQSMYVNNGGRIEVVGTDFVDSGPLYIRGDYRTTNTVAVFEDCNFRGLGTRVDTDHLMTNNTSLGGYSSFLTLRRCTVAGNLGCGVRLLDFGHVELVDSIVWNNAVGAFGEASGATYTARTSCVQSGNGAGTLVGCVTNAPGFIGWSGGSSTVYVHSVSSCPGAGTEANPYCSLSGALKTYWEQFSFGLAAGSPCIGTGSGGGNMGASNGTGAVGVTALTVAAGPGTYGLGGRNLLMDVSIYGEDPEEVVITNTIRGLRNGRVLYGVTVAQTGGRGIEIKDPVSPVIAHCVVRDLGENDGIAIDLESFGQAEDARPLISHCRIRGLRANGIRLKGYRGNLKPTIRNCLLHSITNSAGAGTAVAAIFSEGAAATIQSSTIHGHTQNGIYFASSPSYVTSRVENCVMAGSTNDLRVVNSTSIDQTIVSHSDFVTATATGSGYRQLNCLRVNPVLVDPAGLDFRLATNSPCIGLGSNQAWMATAVDLDGGARMVNGTVDMGAYESQGATLLVSPTNRAVGAGAGTTTFVVTNSGGGVMVYSAQSSQAWLVMTNGASGTNGGTISVAYEANPNATARTGLVTVTAAGALNSPTTLTVVQAAGSWDVGYQNLGGGWRRLAWFGDYVPMGGEGWIWHNKHGFMFATGTSTSSDIWFFTNDMGWLWTGSTTYPFLYRAHDSAWLWYNGATNPRWFRNMTANTWESRP